MSQTTGLTRRRFLSISAASALMSQTMPAPAHAATQWRGQALGAYASLRIEGLSPLKGQPILLAVQNELNRLEAIFSLYRQDSALNQLNAQGFFSSPPADLLVLLSLCDRLHKATDGAFDPTVQPLFDRTARAALEGRTLSDEERKGVKKLIGWHHVIFNSHDVILKQPGSALTFNGIAQGYITDRIAALLRSHGLTDVLVNMGEVSAQGVRADKEPWRAAIAQPDGTLVKRVILSDCALATSAPMGTVLDQRGRSGHIFSPKEARVTDRAKLISVSAKSAAVADGLSTAFCALTTQEREASLSFFPDARLEAEL